MADVPYDKRNDDTGQFTPTYSVDDMIAAIEAVDDQPTTSVIAEHLDCGYRTAYNYLRQAESEGMVDRMRVGSTSVWTIASGGNSTDDEREETGDADSA